MSNHVCPGNLDSKQLCARTLAVAASSLSLLFAGCNSQPKPEVAATQFLQDTVKQYGALKSYSVVASWNAAVDGVNVAEERKFDYTAPNLYKVVSTHDNTLQETSVSDGVQLSEYSNVPGIMPLIDYAPETFAAAASAQMKSVLSASDPIYGFLGGDYGKLVAPGVVPSYGESLSLAGVDCQTVVFKSPVYGQIEAVVGIKDHTVRRIKFDGASLITGLKSKDTPMFAKTLPNTPIKSAEIVETYSGESLNPTLPETTFDTRIPFDLPPFNPTGKTLPEHVASSDGGDSGSGEASASGLPIGTIAPDITVTDVKTGSKMTLSSLRGHPVMIDFWATWCPPCRESLPLTQEFASKYGPQGLQVMAISSEDTDTITAFIKKNKYTFPTYKAADDASLSSYHVNGIPALFLIDKDGKIAHFQEGYGGPEPEREALKQIGFGS